MINNGYASDINLIKIPCVEKLLAIHIKFINFEYDFIHRTLIFTFESQKIAQRCIEGKKEESKLKKFQFRLEPLIDENNY